MARSTNLWTRTLVVLMAIAWGVAGVRADEDFVQTSPRIDLTFDGGTAAEFANTVRERTNYPIAVMTGCEQYRMPALDLRGVDAYSALQPLKYAEPIDPTNTVPLAVDVGSAVYVVAPARPLVSMSVPTQLQAFSLAEILESGKVSAEDTLTAVETALEMSEDDDVAIKYHPETQLLMVRGTPEAIDTVDRVLDGIVTSAQTMNAGAHERDRARQDMAEVEAQLQAATQIVEESQTYAEQVEELVKQQVAGPLDLLHARQQVIDAQKQRDEIAGKLRILEEHQAAMVAREKELTERREAEERAKEKSNAQPGSAR